MTLLYALHISAFSGTTGTYAGPTMYSHVKKTDLQNVTAAYSQQELF